MSDGDTSDEGRSTGGSPNADLAGANELLKRALPDAGMQTERTIRWTDRRAQRSHQAKLDNDRVRYCERERKRWQHTDDAAEEEARRRRNGTRPNLDDSNFGAVVTHADRNPDPDAGNVDVGSDWF